MSETAFMSLLLILKVLLAALSVVFLFGFFIQWKFGKYRLPTMAFYTKKRFVKHHVTLGTGIVCLSLAYIVDFIKNEREAGGGQPLEGAGIIISLLETAALVFIGYSYYKLVRLRIPE